MDPRLLKYYNRELQFIREMAGEFAAEYPKIASRLSLDGFECADPYVERLLEGFAFIAARVHLKFDAEFPRFTQHLLETVYPHYLSPMPSMAITQFQPNLSESSLAKGFLVPRGSALKSRATAGEQTSCDYRTAQDTTVWPLILKDAAYLPSVADLAALGIAEREAKAGLRLRFEVTAGVRADQLDLDQLVLYLRGGKQTPIRLYEQLIGNSFGFLVRPSTPTAGWQDRLHRGGIRPAGFSDSEALLPQGPRSFSGYRLLQEYFAFPSRFHFVRFDDLQTSLKRCADTGFELIVLLNRQDPELVRAVSPSEFALHCCPAINLFPKRADRIHLNERDSEFHVLPDRARPMDFEVYSISAITGFGGSVERRFEAFYASDDRKRADETGAYFTTHRLPRMLSSKQRQFGPRSSYIGSEVYVALVDSREAPYSGDLQELSVETLCTNRDLPLQMPVEGRVGDFTLLSGGPIEGVACLSGPTRPRPAPLEGETHWRLINHLTLNYLSLVDINEQQGAGALRDLLHLYHDVNDSSLRKQVEGITSVRYQPINRRLPSPGPIAFGRGLEVTVTCDENAFEGYGTFVLGSVLEQFFARYVSINSFTETVLRSTDRGEIMRWPTRLGRRHIC